MTVRSTPGPAADLEHALDVMMSQCLGLRAGESLLVIGDARSYELSSAMVRAGARHGAEAALALIDIPGARGDEPPPPVAAALAAADAYLAPTSRGSLSHTRARIAATAAGARGATLPGVTGDMLARLMSGDFAELRRRGEAVAALLDAADSAHLTCPAGSDLRLDLSGRAGIPDHGDLTAPRAFGNLPAGEAYVAPLGGEGVVAATSGPAGLMSEPMLLDVVDGHLAGGTAPHGPELLELLREQGGELGTNLAELGVGTNAAARVTGNVLEDEKALGTVHVAFGASASIGGTVAVPIHRDVVVVDPTLEVGGTRILERGRWLL